MKYNRTFPTYIQTILSVLLLTILFGGHKVIANQSDSSIGKAIAGTYLLIEADDGGSRIVTIGVDGSWFGMHSYQLNNSFSNQQGSWKQTKKRRIRANTLNFSLLKEGVGSSLFTFNVEFDEEYQYVSGELFGKMFPSGVDPLDPVAVPIKTFSNTFTGKRLTVNDD
ncbi:MAG: hypothetical protein D8M57_09125 [Candidatus Scalindua sp. AMX11]|nr:MAG: hypothetical protein DWQ00_00645 [Candidatus Scalindua sp.]NOG83045.1 hypothetical protein [Planctomycetota bacterium]RZV79555.1 MAG: hypothetical protein EX341_11000 [Candidatus Scalindua sp. SCAELEC01]TDE65194.1 MAG: hypothetical protein D8M57_09125 [Candidatus Scalindua sp. AMX11]GJQ58569.1 MAG: hypothetical protein SCALA701_13700 [Candidatus Scalindua sp.]